MTGEAARPGLDLSIPPPNSIDSRPARLSGSMDVLNPMQQKSKNTTGGWRPVYPCDHRHSSPQVADQWIGAICFCKSYSCRAYPGKTRTSHGRGGARRGEAGHGGAERGWVARGGWGGSGAGKAGRGGASSAWAGREAGRSGAPKACPLFFDAQTAKNAVLDVSSEARTY